MRRIFFNFFQNLLTTLQFGSTILLDEQMFGFRKNETHDTAFVEGGGRGRAGVQTIKSRGDNLGAWRLAASGSGDASGNTGDLPLRWATAYGERGVLRRVTGRACPDVGGARWLATLRSGEAGGIVLNLGVFFCDFFDGR